jgi:hypothetical protein
VAPNLEKIEAGKAYLVQESTSSDSIVLQFHRIYQRSGNIYLRYSPYVFLDEVFVHEVTKKRLVLASRDWDQIGQQMEWEELPLNKLQEAIIRPCRIIFLCRMGNHRYACGTTKAPKSVR